MHEQAIDETSADEVLEAGYSADADRPRPRRPSSRGSSSARTTATRSPPSRSSTPAAQPQRLTFREVKELAAGDRAARRTSGRPRSSGRPTSSSTARRCAAPAQRVLTDLVSLVRVALHQEDELVPYPDLVRERYHAWLLQQENAGRVFTAEQLAWLERIRDHVAAVARRSRPTTSATRRSSRRAGSARRRRCSATTSAPLLDEINEVLAA